MSYWIYNMGLAVPVSHDLLLRQNSVKPLADLAKAANSESQNPTETPTKANPVHGRTNPYAQNKPAAEPMPIRYAEDIMSTNVKVLYNDMSFFDAWEKFKTLRYRHFPVLDVNNLIVGIISDRDMLAMAASQKPSMIRINQIMKSQVLTCANKTSIKDVCQVMFRRHVGALPVTDSKNQLLGMITRSDILRAMIKNGPIELWA